MIATDLSKQQSLDADQINFTRNLDWGEDTTMPFIIEKTEEAILKETIN